MHDSSLEMIPKVLSLSFSDTREEESQNRLEKALPTLRLEITSFP
jgi:hypothetical protein